MTDGSTMENHCSLHMKLDMEVNLKLSMEVMQGHTMLVEVMQRHTILVWKRRMATKYPNSSIPKSYAEALGIIGRLGLGYDSIHVCPNNCVLFRKGHAKLNNCPKCNASRWRDGDGRRKIPEKVLRHFPLIPRLQRMFISKKQSEEVQWHKLKRQPVDNELRHPADGEAWKDFDARPEGSIAEAYIVDECLTFFSRYFDDVETRFNRPGRNPERDEDSHVGDVSVFNHGVNFIGACEYGEAGADYDRMVCMCKEELNQQGGQINVDKWLAKGFAKWFQTHIGNMRDVSADLYALACQPDLRVRQYSACVVGGVRYHTVDREKNRKTQNSGIIFEGLHDDGYAVVKVDEVMAGYEPLLLEHRAGEDGEINELGEALRTTVQWRKVNIVFPGSKPSPAHPPPPPPLPVQSPPRDDSPMRDDDYSPLRDESPLREQSPPRERSPPRENTPSPPPCQETPPSMQPPQQKRKSTTKSIKAPKRSSAPKRSKTPDLLPYEKTDEQTDAVAAAELKAFLAPKKPPPKVYIAPNTMKDFVETRQKKAELACDYDRSLGQSSRARKAKKIAQLGEQENQSLPTFVVQSYDDPETASMIERSARGYGADVQYEDYYPMAEVVNKYQYGHDLVKPGQLARLGTQMRRLHEWYLQACRNSDRYFTVAVRDEHYFRGKEEINLEFEELFQLFNQDALDKSIISCYCIMKMLECKRGKLYDIGFIDPNTVHEVTVRRYAKDTEDNLLMFLQKQANKEEIFFPYNFK
ncbi:hypothetical protein QYE76_047482 [Lolium multiflorum]|uniref:Transposon protein, putative, CACTA, En/Spm sub-class n=1 Tax=Lolium multiflorum TaxID=4521 RepID=A0AAD8TNW9_LOLMU|nr:hypothetical protein QYE76_047482 [Lolium multiflorum]